MSVTQRNVFGISFASMSGWSVFWYETSAFPQVSHSDSIGPGKMVDRTTKSVSATPELIPRQLKSVTVIG